VHKLDCSRARQVEQTLLAPSRWGPTAFRVLAQRIPSVQDEAGPSPPMLLSPRPPWAAVLPSHLARVATSALLKPGGGAARRAIGVKVRSPSLSPTSVAKLGPALVVGPCTYGVGRICGVMSQGMEGLGQM
jgi:hypothetical protein